MNKKGTPANNPWGDETKSYKDYKPGDYDSEKYSRPNSDKDKDRGMYFDGSAEAKEAQQSWHDAWAKHEETKGFQTSICPRCWGSRGGMVKPPKLNELYWFPGPNGERPDTSPKWRNCMNCSGRGTVPVPPGYVQPMRT